MILPVWLLAGAFAWAQATTGQLQVAVTDPSGAPVAEAAVRVRGEEGSRQREARTSSDGVAVFPALPAGVYSLVVEQAGLAPARVEALMIPVGQRVVQRVTLTPAALEQKLEVTAEADALATTSTASDTSLGYDRIEETPAVVRNHLSFVFTAPGAAASNGSNTQRSMAGTRNVANDSGFVMGGLRGRNNSLTIDGVDNRDETTGGNRVAIGLEMVQEFRVGTTVVSAETGGAAGGFVNAVTRSGTNVWHGDTTMFFQHEAFNARHPEVTGGKQTMRRYQPGVSLLGPAVRDRTFFAVAYEQSEESAQEWSETPPALAGLFGAGVRPGLYPVRETDTELSFKLNHTVSAKHSLLARHAFSRGRVSNDVLTVENFSDFSARASSLLRDHSFVAALSSVPRPSLVNDLRVQWATRRAVVAPNSRVEMVEIPGVITFGQGYRADQARTENHAEVVESLAWTAGRHTLSLGGSAHAIMLDNRQLHRFAGLAVYPNVAAYVARRPSLRIQAFAARPEVEMTTTPLSGWAHDHWQPRPGWTVDLGLRFDRQRMPAGLPSSSTNFAPRAGVAWRPAQSSWVLRAGGGLFFDRYPLAWLNDALQKDGRQGFELVNGSRSFYQASADFPSTRAAKAAAGIERLLDRDTTLSLDVSFARGLHLPRTRNARAALPAVWLLEQTARSTYTGATLTLNRRVSSELNFIATYTAGRTIDDGSDFDEHPHDPLDLRRERALSRQHQLHRVSASGLFQLPVEDGSRWPAWLREPLEEITIAPIFSFGSGRPLNAIATAALAETGAYPLAARPFSLGRNPFYSPATQSLDVRVFKTLDVKAGRAKWFLGVEAFNALNHTNRLRVSPYFADGAARLGNYGGAIEIMNARQLQWFSALEF